MHSKALVVTTLALILLVACSGGANPLPAPIQTLVHQIIPPSPSQGGLFPPGITNEPLAVVTTLPTDKADEVAVTKDKTRIIVQFNHPVVPLVAVEQQKDLPQPLTLQPLTQGTGQWINTSTFAFTPSADLVVATQYTASLTPLTDMLGQSLGNFSWSFKTAAPAILQTYPPDNSKFAGVTQPITMTFNTAMDRASTESRFSVKLAGSNSVANGKIEWQGLVMRFVPSPPLEYDRRYVASLQAGAQDVNRAAATIKDTSWTFNSTPAPGVVSTAPIDRDQKGKVDGGFVINFASPMNQDSLKVTLQPTIANQALSWERGKVAEADASITARVRGNWLASTPYTMTIGADSTTRYGEKLGKDVVVRFTSAPRAPDFQVNVPGLMGMYDANGTQTIIATYTNINQIDYKLYKVDRADFLSMIPRDYQNFDRFAPKEANRLRAWSLPTQAPLNATRLISTTLTADGAPLAPGVYYLQASSPEVTTNDRRPVRHLLVVSSLNLALKRTETEALVWVTDLKSGKPVANIPITLYDSSGRSLVTERSDKDGILRAKFVRQEPFDALYALSEEGGQIVAAVGSDWSEGIAAWDYNVPYEPRSQEFYANLYTDRSIYRPGQSVYFKGILRRDNDAQYALPSDIESVPVKVTDAQGKQLFTQNVSLTKFGTFNGEVKLSDAAAIGNYQLYIELGKEPRKFYSGTSFVVAEYRRPEYQVEVQADKLEYFSGDTVKVDANAAYFFGGAVNDAQVTWRLLSDDLFFQPENVKGYWDFTDYDLAAQRQRFGGVIRQGKGKTDAQGKFHFEVPADLKDTPLSQVFTLEAEVTDINNQSVSSRTAVPVHKGKYYIGLRPQRYVGTVAQEQAIDAITVDTKGDAVPNQSLAVSFFDHQWYSVREKQNDGSFYWKSSYTDTLVSKVDVTTNAQGAAVAKFTPSKGGVYKILAEGKDASGNAIRSATYLWVSGREYINWRIENNDRIDLIADKKEYTPGDSAEILIAAPFANSEALLTIERGSIREARHITLPGNSERIKIPILSDYAPNVYVSVLLVKGRGADSPVPQFKLGYVNLAVSTTEKQLKISVAPDKTTHYAPGEKATFTISATDSANKPVQSEFSVALVDKAVQSLIDDRSESPLEAFYRQRGLGVSTSATLARSVERVNQQLSPESKGGGGGLLEQPVRRDFRDTAFWKADIVTDAQGRAQVSIPLPDNLTTWNLTAKGVTTATQVGDARADIVSTKDLLLRPVTPRFFVVGDKAHLEAVVNNNTDKDVSADVRLDAQGLTLSGNAQQPLTIRAHDKAKVAWDTTVNAAALVVVKFTTTGGGLQDAVEQTLPVLRPSSPEVVGTAGQVDTQTKEQIQLPPVLDKSAGELKIELSPSLAAASRNSLKYLESFDYECSEQTVSKFFPNVATYLALKKFGIERPDLQLNLQVNVSREVQRLYSLQNQDGGWGWWFAGASNPTLTAYALLALYNAKQAGFAVDDNVMKLAQEFLMRAFEKPLDVKAAYTFNERAFVIFTLTEIGGNYTSRAVALFDQRANLANYGKAYLMMAMQKLKLPQAQTLQGELTSAAVPSATGAHWEEAQIDYWTMNTNTRSTALAIMALSRADPKNATLANAVRWLMIARKEGHWQTTQETAWSVLALTEYMQSTGELQASYTYQASVNNKAIGNGKVDKTNVDQPGTFSVAIKDLLLTAANDLSITRNAGDGRLYYSAFLNYYLPVDNLPALNKGIIVARQYQAVDPQTLKPTGQVIQSAKIGDYVKATLTIIAANDLHYVVLEDPLPAGFEAVDTTLKTSSSAAQTPQLQERKSVEQNAEDRWFRPYWYYWANTEVRDDRVAMFATYLGRGTYEYSYVMRASLAGEFRTLPARAWEMYFPDVFGRSSGATFTVGQ